MSDTAMTPERKKSGPKGPHQHPLLKKVPLNTKVAQWVVDELRKEPNQAKVIESSIIRALKIIPPKIEKP